MAAVNMILDNIYTLIYEEGQSDFSTIIANKISTNDSNQKNADTDFDIMKCFLSKIIKEIDDVAAELRKDETVLISVRHQKLLRTCFQLITSLGISPSLIPGLGLSLSKRCSLVSALPPIILTDEQKYHVLVFCADFFTRSYDIPVLKNIIITFHMSDYLAALIQLSFAPLKKPGTYKNFVMTEELFEKLNSERKKYIKVFDHLVATCFQPILMKELLVLQSVSDPPPPMFVKRVIAKQMSQRLLVAGGLLSLIRCFIESYNIDTGFEWKKIDMICKIVASKHGNESEDEYLQNICTQITEILRLSNTHYLTTAVACVLGLNKKFPQSKPVKLLKIEVFQSFDCENMLSKSNLPGTIILTSQEVEHKVKILHACTCTVRIECPNTLLTPNLYLLFLLGVKCTKNEEMKTKLKDILLKILEQTSKEEIVPIVKKLLFGDPAVPVLVEEYEAGLCVKCGSDESGQTSDQVLYFINLFKLSTDSRFVKNIFEACLHILIELSKRRSPKNELLVTQDDDNVVLDDADGQYANILQLLGEISASPKVVSALKQDPSIVLDFIEYFITNSKANSSEECVIIAVLLLNTILSNTNTLKGEMSRLRNLIPLLKKMSKCESDFNNILCEETLSLISSENPKPAETACTKAISDVFDELLPVRAHGVIELTKLIDAQDPETISKKHYIFCLFQEQLKDPDSYIYLSAINGIASLCTHCTEDVLQVLCKEFLQISSEQNSLETKEDKNKNYELRMKIGDVIVKVTKRLGEMAIVHKTILLNTMLCACRDDDPLIRTSALSNLAEIALVLHYKIGTIIYELLLCLWSIIETDKAVECRRAAVMVIVSLLKGLGKDTLSELKENILPIYRTLKTLYKDENEDSVVRLHAQLAIEELNDIVRQFILPQLSMEKRIVMEKDVDEIIFK